MTKIQDCTSIEQGVLLGYKGTDADSPDHGVPGSEVEQDDIQVPSAKGNKSE